VGSIWRKTHPALPTHTPQTVSKPLGRWMKVQGRFKVQAHIISGVVVDVAAFKVSHSVSDIDATALRAARARSKSIGGRWMKCHKKVQNARSHPCPLPHTQGTRSIQRGNGTLHVWVRFGAKLTEVCHDTPPTVSIPVGRWNVTCVGSIRRKTHVALPRYTANSEHTIGAMDESSGKVQDTSTHNKRCCHGCCSLQS
jgi:hypothetical protein